MPALISPNRPTFRPSASATKLQAAKEKADIIIQKLRESGDRDVADVLISRYEELKKRHDRLIKLQETTTDEESQETSTDEDSEEETTTSRQINLDQLDDGTFKLTFPPDEVHEQPNIFVLTSPAFKKDEPIQNIKIIAEELIKTAMLTIGAGNEQNFQESQMMYLTNMYESLTAQKDKINSLEKDEASPAALEIAVQLYLTDAFRYLQSTQMILNADTNEGHGDDSDTDGSDSDNLDATGS